MDEELEPFDDLAAFDETDPQDDQGQQPDEQADPAARVWLYGKREARPGRKMGHVNRLTPL